MRPKRITWSQYREARRWQWKVRKYGFIYKTTAAAREQREQFNSWWLSPTGRVIKHSGGEFKMLAEEAGRRKAMRALKRAMAQSFA